MPQRLHRTRKMRSATPPGAVYVGRPTLWANPFGHRPNIGHKRGVILHRAWLAGDLTAYVLRCAHFSEAEVQAVRRWQGWVIAARHRLTGRDLQCWCPLSSDWCHADALLRTANR